MLKSWMLHRPICWAFGKVFGRHFWNGRGDTWCFTCGVTRYWRSRYRLTQLMFRDTGRRMTGANYERIQLMPEQKTTETRSTKTESVDWFGDKTTTEKTETKVNGKKTESK